MEAEIELGDKREPRSRIAMPMTASTAYKEKTSKLSTPGRIISKTPAKPIVTARIRCIPTFSPKKMNEINVINRGRVCKIAATEVKAE